MKGKTIMEFKCATSRCKNKKKYAQPDYNGCEHCNGNEFQVSYL
jgi:Zn finger protein HypA/HybF involved in hydrogenase expression|tara:strand:+ start:171 stop:302 length:132 start_codon:yes stop_codon:yes gene_type:complete